jgi:predicted amidohydrolase YtcJ
LLAPKCVHLHAADLGVDLRERQVRGLAELEEALLELADCPGQGREVVGQRNSQRPRTRATSTEHRFDLVGIEQPAVVRLDA